MLILLLWFKIFSNDINGLKQIISFSTVVMFDKNMKHPSSVITMKMLQNFYSPIQISNYTILSFSCWLRGKSELPLLNDKVKVVNSCVKTIWI